MLQYFLANRESMTIDAVLYLMFGYALLILVFLPLHEFAHAGVAYLCGDRTALWHGRLTLNPLKHLDPWGTAMMLLIGIGYARPVPINPRNFGNYKRDMRLVALAGPASNLLMAVLAVAIFRVCVLFPLSDAAFMALWMILINTVASVNISLAVFNMLPIPPFDGSRLWSSLLPGQWAYTLERYSQYIQIGLFVVLFSGALDGVLSTLHSAVFGVLFFIFGL